MAGVNISDILSGRREDPDSDTDSYVVFEQSGGDVLRQGERPVVVAHETVAVLPGVGVVTSRSVVEGDELGSIPGRVRIVRRTITTILVAGATTDPAFTNIPELMYR